MEKKIEGGKIVFDGNVLTFSANDKRALAAFRTNDKSIFDYIQSEREFFREMDYFYKLSELEVKLTNKSLPYPKYDIPYL